MFTAREFKWHWESSDSIDIPRPVVRCVSEDTVKRKRLHRYLNIYLEKDNTITCNIDDSNIFWLIVLMENGGFLSGTLNAISKDKKLEIAKKAMEREQSMKLIPVGEKEMKKEYHNCIKLLMTDDRIPIWNPVFLRILIATSEMNVLLINDGNIETLAPWKQRRDCLLIKESEDQKRWVIDTISDERLKTNYSLRDFLPNTKTARNKLTKDALYLICSIYGFNDNKITKKSMIAWIDVKLSESPLA